MITPIIGPWCKQGRATALHFRSPSELQFVKLAYYWTGIRVYDRGTFLADRTATYCDRLLGTGILSSVPPSVRLSVCLSVTLCRFVVYRGKSS